MQAYILAIDLTISPVASTNCLAIAIDEAKNVNVVLSCLVAMYCVIFNPLISSLA
jgi:hypothetical protein